MISNQILQNTIDGLKNITRKELSVVEKEGKVIATTEENMIGRQIDAIENFIGSQAESQLILGYQYFKIYDNGIPEYVVQVKGEDEEGYRIGKIAAFQIQSLLVAYKERYDKDNFITSPGIQEFVYQNNLWPKNKPFNFRLIFGTHDDSDLTYNTPRVWSGQKLLTPSVNQYPESFDLPFIRKPDHPVSIQEAQRVLSDHFNGTQYDLTNSKNEGQPAYRPIAVATTQESHLLQLREEDMTHWLAMGIAAQSVYIPFYPQGTKVPTMFKYGKAEFSTNSAYWVFKMASVLVDRNWNKYATNLVNTQKATNLSLNKLRVEYDKKLAQEKDKDKKVELVNEANKKLANVAIKNYQKLNAKLITAQTADSPLRFKIDPNL